MTVPLGPADVPEMFELTTRANPGPFLPRSAVCTDEAWRGQGLAARLVRAVGADHPVQSWAVRLAQELRWNAVVYGVSGAGYARGGPGGIRSMSSLLEAEDLGHLDPELVIVQAGHDDEGVPAAVEASRVRAVISQIRAAAPHARIALLTTVGAVSVRTHDDGAPPPGGPSTTSSSPVRPRSRRT